MFLEAFLAFFRGKKLANVGAVFTAMAPILQHLEENYAEDKDTKNALIDTMIQLLNSHKDKV